MCIQTALQQKIAELTNNGETIAMFLVDTLQSNNSDIKRCHKLDAARLLAKYGIPTPDNIINHNQPDDTTNTVGATLVVAHPNDDSVHGEPHHDTANGESDEPPTHNSEPKTDNPARPEPVEGRDRQPGPTLYDIVAYPIARYIRERTNQGETLIEALQDVINDTGEYDSEAAFGFRRGTARPPAKPHHKLAASNELLRRALGESTRRRKSPAYDPAADIDDSDPLNGHLARLIRAKTNDGTEAAELLIRIAENDQGSGDWKPAHRVSAARELFHRAYDLNYDAVTWQQVQAYKQATDFADEGETLEQARSRADRDQLLREYKEAYESGDEDASEKAEAKYHAYNRYIAEGKDPDTAMKYAGYGPSDPDPEYEEEMRKARLPRRNPEAGKDAASDNRTTAATIHTPRLTIPINNRSP